jgi:hypothetical protein
MVSRVLLCALLLTAPLSAYSVLAHEAIIDSVWQDHLAPLIEKKFTGASEPDLRTARAYGGCIVQDMGYYPFVSEWFSDLAHYVRSGDLVKAMLRLAADRNEYAFALGALAHVAGDGFGHPFINRAVPLTYPKLLGKFGPVVTFNDHRRSHIQTEFGFDVLQIARGNYAPQRYHDFIGFEVSKPALERAFRLTYGIELDDMFLSPDLALGTYRWTVSRLIPRATKAAWALKEPDITKARPALLSNSSSITFRAGIMRSSGDAGTESPESDRGFSPYSSPCYRKLDRFRRCPSARRLRLRKNHSWTVST